MAAAVSAGFFIGFGLPTVVGKGNTIPPETRPRPSPRRAAESERLWTDSRSSAGDRMAEFIDRASKLTPAGWPTFFRAQRNSPEWLRLAAQIWADRDPQGFWNHLREGRDRLELEKWSGVLLKTLATADPDAAMAAVMAITDKLTGDRMRGEVVDTMLAGDLSKGLEFAAKAGDFSLFTLGPRDWIDRAPEAAVRGLAVLPLVSDYRNFLGDAIQAWRRWIPPRPWNG